MSSNIGLYLRLYWKLKPRYFGFLWTIFDYLNPKLGSGYFFDVLMLVYFSNFIC